MQTEDVTNTKGTEFEDFFLKRELLMGIFEKGFERLSPVQEELSPSPSPGGASWRARRMAPEKPEHLSFPHLRKPTCRSHIQGLILVPTRELALQTSAAVKEIGKHMVCKSWSAPVGPICATTFSASDRWCTFLLEHQGGSVISPPGESQGWIGAPWSLLMRQTSSSLAKCVLRLSS